jgi:hypothetical protein
VILLSNDNFGTSSPSTRIYYYYYHYGKSRCPASGTLGRAQIAVDGGFWASGYNIIPVLRRPPPQTIWPRTAVGARDDNNNNNNITSERALGDAFHVLFSCSPIRLPSRPSETEFVVAVSSFVRSVRVRSPRLNDLN